MINCQSLVSGHLVCDWSDSAEARMQTFDEVQMEISNRLKLTNRLFLGVGRESWPEHCGVCMGRAAMINYGRVSTRGLGNED